MLEYGSSGAGAALQRARLAVRADPRPADRLPGRAMADTAPPAAGPRRGHAYSRRDPGGGSTARPRRPRGSGTCPRLRGRRAYGRRDDAARAARRARRPGVQSRTPQAPPALDPVERHRGAAGWCSPVRSAGGVSNGSSVRLRNPMGAGYVSPMTTLRTVLFDLDGTLIDSVRLILDSYHHTLAAHGLPARSDEEWLRGVGTPLTSQFAEWRDDRGTLEALTATYRKEHPEPPDRRG